MKIPVPAIARAAAAALLVFGIVVLYFKYVHVNPTTLALSLLVSILVVSAAWGLRYAIPMSILSTLCFNFFFLPPVGTLTIVDPQNWVALIAFLCTSLIASHLSERVRDEARESARPRQEVERLYRFSKQLLLTDNIVEILKITPVHVVETFGLENAAIHLGDRDKVYRSGAEIEQLSSTELKAVSATGEPVFDREHKRCLVPVSMGLRRLGSLGIAGDTLSRETLEAMSGLIAIAIERAGAVDTLMRSEASRESERLRSALLDSITHEFRTPLTSIKASVTSLKSKAEMNEEQRRDFVEIIDEESDRLNRLIGEAVEMARLDANQVKLG